MTEVTQLMEALDGVASRSDLTRAGLSGRQILCLEKQQSLVRIRGDAFVEGGRWRGAAPWDRHALRARAVARAMRESPGRYALSHHSALSVLGVGTDGVDDRVHVVGLDGQPSRRADLLTVHTAVEPDRVTAVDGMAAVPIPLACVQVASRHGSVPGLVSADIALSSGRMTLEDLRHEVARYHGYRGHRQVRELGLYATPLHESAGETRTSAAFRLLGLPEPERQVEIHDPEDGFRARVDFLFRAYRTIVEFDGMLKYDRREVLGTEKQREDRLRALGFEVVRLVWADLSNLSLVRQRVLDAFRRAEWRADVRAAEISVSADR